MFCCWRSKCLEYNETRQHDKDMNNPNNGIYDQRNSLLSKQYEDKLTTDILKHVSNSHGSLRTRDNMNVTSIQTDSRKPSNRHTYSYRGDSYPAIQVPKSESTPVRQTSTRDNVPQSSRVRHLSANNSHPSNAVIQAPGCNNASQSDSGRQLDPAIQASTAYLGVTDDDIKLKCSNEAIDIFSDLDAASLTDKQKDRLEQLNSAFNVRHSDDESPNIYDSILPYKPVTKSGDDNGDEIPIIDISILPYRPVTKSGDDNGDEIPNIVVDILPYGQFEELKVTLEPSEYEPLSRYLHFRNKSMNSQNGIISEKRLSNKRRNSVSFRLPIDHVDKPYSPMKTRTWSKAKTLPMQTTQPVRNNPYPAICISGNDVNIWHTRNTVYVNDRRSLKLPFYGIYGFTETATHSAYTTYLEQFKSFANTIDDNVVLKSRENSIFRHKMIR